MFLMYPLLQVQAYTGVSANSEIMREDG